MDFLSYRGLPMSVLQSTVHERAPQHDKSHTTYECTRWLVSFLVTYNPGAISFVNAGPFGAIQQAGQMPVATDRAIKDFLEQPRGQLIVRSASNPTFSPSQLVNPSNDPNSLVIVSPTGSRPCDVRNGPFCKVNSIQFVPGERLWKIHLTFETYTNPTSNLILNNRWSVHADINWQHLTTRIYQGICTVNGALLNDPAFATNIPGYQSRRIDSIRPSFAGFAVQPGFQRTYVKVEVTPDGNSAAYVVRDEEQLYSKPGDPNVPRIEVLDSNWIQKTGWGAAVASNMNPIGAGVAFLLRKAGASQDVAQGFAPTLPTTHLAVAAAQVPKMSRTVIVRLWGNWNRTRNRLVQSAMAIAANRLGNIALFDIATGEVVVNGDSNNLVSVTWTVKWGRENAFGNFTNFVLNGGGTVVGGTTSNGTTAWVNSLGQNLSFALPQNNQMTGAHDANPPFPALNGTAGTLTGNGIAPLITQVLESFSQSPGPLP